MSLWRVLVLLYMFGLVSATFIRQHSMESNVLQETEIDSFRQQHLHVCELANKFATLYANESKTF